MEKKKRTILLIDDDSFLLEMYATKFTEKGFAVRSFGRGEDAFAALKEGFSPDVILFDVIMPEMSGEEFLMRRKKEKIAPDALLVGLSNQSDERTIETMKKQGLHQYILKASMVPSQVVTEVERLLAEQK